MDQDGQNSPSEPCVDRATLVSEDGKNIKAVVCQRCGSKVLSAGSAQFEEREIFLPSMRKKTNSTQSDGSVDGDTVTAHWVVGDIFDFENVGFTKGVGNIKYLICADCEIGPIGWHFIDEKRSYYVALERVNHA